MVLTVLAQILSMQQKEVYQMLSRGSCCLSFEVFCISDLLLQGLGDTT